MVDTIENVKLPFNEWVDLYAATNIDVGTSIAAQNIGVSDVYLFSGASPPG